MQELDFIKQLPKDYGVMLCGHGSRSKSAVSEFQQLAHILKETLDPVPCSYGFLEFATPIINDGLKDLQAQGVKKVLAIPGMLFAAGHAKNDIPSVLNMYQKEHGLDIQYGRELGIDTRMVRAAGARVEEAMQESLGRTPKKSDYHETLLVVVGRGASDPDANSNACKITRLLWEGLGFGWAETAYSGVTFPLVEPALHHITHMPFKRIIVFPYFLFSGILIDRIYTAVDTVSAHYPDIEFVKAPYLNSHPLVVNTFIARVHEILEGTGVMNCQLCKYRMQVLGFEDEVGLQQESHHHHVEGIGTHDDTHHAHDNAHDHDHAHDKHTHDHAHDKHTHDHDHGHDHEHGHDHHHHPYPHADHPLGSKTLK